MFLQSISFNISDYICCNECINSNSLKGNVVQVNEIIDEFISTTTFIDNSPVLSSKYSLVESLSIKTSNLNNNPFHVIK